MSNSNSFSNPQNCTIFYQNKYTLHFFWRPLLEDSTLPSSASLSPTRWRSRTLRWTSLTSWSLSTSLVQILDCGLAWACSKCWREPYQCLLHTKFWIRSISHRTGGTNKMKLSSPGPKPLVPKPPISLKPKGPGADTKMLQTIQSSMSPDSCKGILR